MLLLADVPINETLRKDDFQWENISEIEVLPIHSEESFQTFKAGNFFFKLFQVELYTRPFHENC